MRVLLALILGAIIGAAVIWLVGSPRGKEQARSTGQQIEDAAKSTKDAVQDKLQVLDLRPQDIKEELNKTGQVIRRKAHEAGQAIADATADARTTGAIKAKLLANRSLSSLSISVNTTGGVVTLSGTVPSTEDISQVMLLAMEVDGVREVVSTLQVKKDAPQK